jgi:hypothetical protein
MNDAPVIAYVCSNCGTESGSNSREHYCLACHARETITKMILPIKNDIVPVMCYDCSTIIHARETDLRQPVFLAFYKENGKIVTASWHTRNLLRLTPDNIPSIEHHMAQRIRIAAKNIRELRKTITEIQDSLAFLKENLSTKFPPLGIIGNYVGYQDRKLHLTRIRQNRYQIVLGKALDLECARGDLYRGWEPVETKKAKKETQARLKDDLEKTKAQFEEKKAYIKKVRANLRDLEDYAFLRKGAMGAPV